MRKDAVVSKNSKSTSSSAKTALTYLAVDPNADRDRLYRQYELFRDDFNAWFDRALALSNLATDPETATWRVLDVGCGEGLFAREIHVRYPRAQVVGFDRDPEAIATATTAFGRRGNPRFYVHDALAPLPAEFEPDVPGDGRFDIVFAHVVLMHLRDPATALRHLAAALKPGGAIYLRDCPTDPVAFPHPGLAPLYAAAMEGLCRTAVPNFARQHTEYLTAAGFTQIESGTTVYAVGGPTAAGQQMLRNVVSGLQAARAGLVEHLRLLNGAEFDAYVQRYTTESSAEMLGEIEEVNTIARKPAQE
jgi:SAM-dependent methyltransferase